MSDEPLKVGTRVVLHAATDHWMRGDRYGVILGRGRHRMFRDRETGKTEMTQPYKVCLDKSEKVVYLHPTHIFPLDEI